MSNKIEIVQGSKATNTYTLSPHSVQSILYIMRFRGLKLLFFQGSKATNISAKYGVKTTTIVIVLGNILLAIFICIARKCLCTRRIREEEDPIIR